MRLLLFTATFYNIHFCLNTHWKAAHRLNAKLHQIFQQSKRTIKYLSFHIPSPAYPILFYYTYFLMAHKNCSTYHCARPKIIEPVCSCSIKKKCKRKTTLKNSSARCDSQLIKKFHLCRYTKDEIVFFLRKGNAQRLPERKFWVCA